MRLCDSRLSAHGHGCPGYRSRSLDPLPMLYELVTRAHSDSQQSRLTGRPGSSQRSFTGPQTDEMEGSELGDLECGSVQIEMNPQPVQQDPATALVIFPGRVIAKRAENKPRGVGDRLAQPSHPPSPRLRRAGPGLASRGSDDCAAVRNTGGRSRLSTSRHRHRGQRAVRSPSRKLDSTVKKLQVRGAY